MTHEQIKARMTELLGYTPDNVSFSELLNTEARIVARAQLNAWAMVLGDPNWFACQSRLLALTAAERGEGVGEA
jgi:hypothetical protein